MTTRVKISGITRLADARYCAGAGAAYLGFDQSEGSPRYAEPSAAKEIIEWLDGVEAVGVFVDEEAEAVNARCAAVGFGLAQLDGHEPPEVVAAVGVPTIKTFRVQHDASSEQLRALMLPYRGVADFFLLDTHRTSLWGGTGESFNWRLARDLAAEFPLFLAGSIDAGNVQEAVDTMRPYAVDLSSSVEAEPGVKDFDALYDFFEAYRAAVDPA